MITNEQLKNKLNNKLILITGAAGGIGYETAKNLAFMGAKVIILDIAVEKGNYAKDSINNLYKSSCEFYKVDLANEEEILDICKMVEEKYGIPDVIFNNACILHLGNIDEVSSDSWDNGYKVNFKAPVILTKYFLNGMKKRNSGSIVFVSSSGAAGGMGAYEIFKTAQVELSNTLSIELEGTNIYTYTISPGLVKTETAMKSIEVVSKKMNISLDEFYKMNESHIISVEDAGLGFALSVLNACDYNGQELGSIQVLNSFDNNSSKSNKEYKCDSVILRKVCDTYKEQYTGWKKRNIFERQWVLRDFKKTTSLSADEVLNEINNFNTDDGIINDSQRELLKKLIDYWKHQYQLLQGFEKNPDKLKEFSNTINNWISDIENCIKQNNNN